jgi:hypothetical protein
MVYTLRFLSSKCSLFHNSNVFGSCITYILYTGCAKIKIINSGAKRLNDIFIFIRTRIIYKYKVYLRTFVLWLMYVQHVGWPKYFYSNVYCTVERSFSGRSLFGSPIIWICFGPSGKHFLTVIVLRIWWFKFSPFAKYV